MAVACGGRSELFGDDEQDDAGGSANAGVAGASAGNTSIPAAGNGAVSGGNGGVSGAGNEGGSDFQACDGAISSAGSCAGAGGGVIAGAGGDTDRAFPETVLEDMPVSTGPGAPQKWTPDPFALACGSRECAIFSNQRGTAVVQHISFPGPTGLAIGSQTYVGRMYGGGGRISSEALSIISDGERYLLVWRQYYATRGRWMARRMLESTKAWLDPEPVPLSDWSEGYHTVPALSWDGQRILAVLPDSKSAELVLLRSEALKLVEVLRMQLPLVGGVVRAASAELGEFVVMDSRYSTAPGKVTAYRFAYNDTSLLGPFTTSLPDAVEHASVSFVARPGAYAFSWRGKSDTSTQVSLLAPHTLKELKRTTVLKRVGRFALSGKRLIGIDAEGEMVALDAATLEQLPSPPKLERTFESAIVPAPHGEVLVGHRGWSGDDMHVHRVRQAGADTSGALMAPLVSSYQRLRAFATDGIQYLVAWRENKGLMFRRFDKQLRAIDSAPWAIPELATIGESDWRPLSGFVMTRVSDRFLLTWWTPEHGPRVGFLDPALRKVTNVQELAPLESRLIPQEVVSQQGHVWIPLVETGATALKPYLYESWLRVAELKPNADRFEVSGRLSPDQRPLKNASIAPIVGINVAVWWEGNIDYWPSSTLHVQAYNQSWQADAQSRKFAVGWPVDGELSETASGLRIVAHPTNPRGLLVAARDDGIHAGLVSRQVDTLKLTSFPEQTGWGVAARDGVSVVALKNGCWLASWSHFADLESPVFSRRLCDKEGTLEMHPLHRWGLGGDRAASGRGALRTAAIDGEQVVFALDALDPISGTERVRLSFVPEPNEL